MDHGSTIRSGVRHHDWEFLLLSIPLPQRRHKQHQQREKLKPSENHQKAEQRERIRTEVTEVVRRTYRRETGADVKDRPEHTTKHR